MKPDPVPPTLRLPKKLYALLLCLYPRSFRREYGCWMMQLYCDQCRDAARRSGWFGLVRIGVRAAADLAKTVPVEHWHEIQRRSHMLKNLYLGSQLTVAKTTLILLAAFVTFFSIVSGAVIMSLNSPTYYSNAARICVNVSSLAPGNSIAHRKAVDEVAIRVRSSEITDQVFQELGLESSWAKKYGNTKEKSRSMLAKGIEIRTIRNSSLIDIQVMSRSPADAADIANKIAYISCELMVASTRTPTCKVQMIDAASRDFVWPVNVKHLFNFMRGSILGGVASLGVAAFLLARFSRNSPPPASSPA